MYQFTAKLSGSYPQQQVHQMLGVHQEHGQNQNFWRAPEPPIKQEFHIQPEQPSFFESAEHGEARTSDDWPRQTGITPFQGPAEPVIKRGSHAQEGQLMVYDDRQSSSARNAWVGQAVPAQDVPYRSRTFPPPSVNGDPYGHVEYPSVENRSLGVTYGSFGSPHGENHRKKAPRVSQACKQCRQAKAKCQDKKPCQTCADTKQDCEYTISEPKKADEKDLSTITIRLDRQEDLMRQILTHIAGPEAVLNIFHPATESDASIERPEKQSGASHQGFPSSSSSNRLEPFENKEAESLPEFGPAVPLYHSTAASRILLWKSIKDTVGETILGDSFADPWTRDAPLYSTRHGQTEVEPIRDFNSSEPDLRSDTVSRLINLYMNHFNVIHPILSPNRLKALFMHFIKSSNSAKSTSKAGNEEARRLKRRRLVGEAEALNGAFIGSKMPEPSIELALFLLVLALGKIYDRKENPAHAFYEGGEQPGGSASLRNSYPSPDEVDRSWTDRHPSGNMDITAGLDYFAAATNIIGKIDDRDSQCYVQVQILTSLYQKQLGLLSKSHAAISEAARALQVILRSKNTQSRTTGWDNALLVAFWTCLMIESEMIAELPVPQSNLDSWERFMPWPNVHAEDFMNSVNTVQRDGYRTQLLIRKHLNTIYAKLYGQGHQDKVYKVPLEEQATSSIVQSTIDDLDIYLSKMAQPPASESSDSNSITILTTWLNSKILAAKAIALRPCLMMVLNREDAESEISEKVQDYARLCIETLQLGATAFNYLKGDQLVAHAQWGNVIILLAAFSDASLKQFIRPDLLGYLVEQTLDSLMAWSSSALEQKHVKVLKAMALKAGLYEQPKLRNGHHS